MRIQASLQTDVGSVKSEIFPVLGLTDSLPGVFSTEWFGSGPYLEKRSPIDGSFLARIAQATREDYDRAAAGARRTFLNWRTVPAPKRGGLVRRLGERLRELKAPLGRLVSLETGKILAEAEGEVQEMIDICDFANGLSRQLYGLTIASERENHRMFEQWHPLGLVGIISAFNFPVAVWSWNSALAIVCGNSTLWKPSEKTPLTAIACIRIAEQVSREFGIDPTAWSLAVGGSEIGRLLAEDTRVPLVSATGSTRMGRTVSEIVSHRLGRTLLELGGNNAIDCHPIRGSRPGLKSSVVRSGRNRRSALHHHSPADRTRIRPRAFDGIFVRSLSPSADRKSTGPRHGHGSTDRCGSRTCNGRHSGRVEDAWRPRSLRR